MPAKPSTKTGAMKPKSKLPIAPKHSHLGSPQKHAEAPTHADHGHESLPGESGERRWEQRNHVPRPETIISLRFRRGIREGLHQTSPPTPLPPTPLSVARFWSPWVARLVLCEDTGSSQKHLSGPRLTLHLPLASIRYHLPPSSPWWQRMRVNSGRGLASLTDEGRRA